MDTENQGRKCCFLLTKQDDPTMWNQIRNSSKPSVWLLWRWLLTVCLDADALIKTLFPGLVLTPKMKISPGYEMTTNLRFHAVIGRHIILVVFIAETAVQVGTIALLFLTDAIFETGASGVPSKSQKSFICGGVGQTITLKSLGKGATPSTPSRGLQ